jgi:hypothetical protein
VCTVIAKAIWRKNMRNEYDFSAAKKNPYVKNL